MYRNATVNYHCNEVDIDEVRCEIGLRQGCALSPLLFMIVMEELTQRIKKTWVRIKNRGKYIEDITVC